MPITINGSGTVTGISAGGLPDGCISEADLASAAVTNAKLGASAVTIDKMGTNEQKQLCKAWVRFNGTGTISIDASYNISSITDVGPGIYTPNFTSALSNSNYTVVCSANGENGISYASFSTMASTTTTGFNMSVSRATTPTAVVDVSVICAVVFQ
jgi:hypothetical protein